MTVCTINSLAQPVLSRRESMGPPDGLVQTGSSCNDCTNFTETRYEKIAADTNGVKSLKSCLRGLSTPYTRRNALPGCAPVCEPLWITGCPFTSTSTSHTSEEGDR